jgi:hypothetical protein
MGTFNGDSQQGLTAGCQFSEPSNRGHSSWGHTSGPGPSTGDTLRVASSRNHPTGAASGDIQVDAALGDTQWGHTTWTANRGYNSWGYTSQPGPTTGANHRGQPPGPSTGAIQPGPSNRSHPSGTRSGDSQTVAAQPGHPTGPSVGAHTHGHTQPRTSNPIAAPAQTRSDDPVRFPLISRINPSNSRNSPNSAKIKLGSSHTPQSTILQFERPQLAGMLFSAPLANLSMLTA